MMLALLESLPSSSFFSVEKMDVLIDKLIDLSVTAGKHILVAIIVYIVGRFIISLVMRLVMGTLQRRSVDVGVQSFLRSFLKVVLTILLVVSVIGALGVNTASFAALLASTGVAVGMALSGHLQNFAGGLIVLVFKPYRVGDVVEAQGVSGTVREIQIFHTIIATFDNKTVYVPNGSLSNSVVVNHSREDIRRVQWTVGVEYGENVDKVRAKLYELFSADERILQDIEGKKPFVGLDALADSSVNLVIRVWVKNEDYWAVFYDGQQRIYDLFNQEGINIPFPQTVVHIEK